MLKFVVIVIVSLIVIYAVLALAVELAFAVVRVNPIYRGRLLAVLCTPFLFAFFIWLAWLLQ